MSPQHALAAATIDEQLFHAWALPQVAKLTAQFIDTGRRLKDLKPWLRQQYVTEVMGVKS